MLHLLKYRFIQITRDYANLFWTMLFPIILGTLFYFSFGNSGLAGSGEIPWETVKVAVIEEDVSSRQAEAFRTFLEELDGDTIEITDINSEKKALRELKEERILGIYYVKDTPSLTVAKNGIQETILTSLLETYLQNASIIERTAIKHPERLEDALGSMENYQKQTKDISLGGKTLDPNVHYFFALIAYACLSGAFLGLQSTNDSQANLSTLGARRSVTPTNKLTLILIDLITLFTVHLICTLILNLYIAKVLGISLGNRPGVLLLVNLMGCMIGVSLGIVLGCIARFSINVKTGFVVAMTLFPSFLAGLMFGTMKHIIELHCPIVNRINPAAVLSDAFYCISVYNDRQLLIRSLLTLAAMSLLCILVAFYRIRRERYDSI